MKNWLLLIFGIIAGSAQWSDVEVRQIVFAANERGLEIERMTKAAAIRQNQINAANSALRPPISTEFPTDVGIGPPMSPQSVSVALPKPVPPPPPPTSAPTVEDDRTFLAKMTEQEALVNHLNALAAREAAHRSGILAMESSILNALRPLAMPFLGGGGQPIAGHFLPLPRTRSIEESPRKDSIEQLSRPTNAQLPLRTGESFQGFFDEQNDDPPEIIDKNNTLL